MEEFAGGGVLVVMGVVASVLYSLFPTPPL
jgi:hypothetical protein